MVYHLCFSEVVGGPCCKPCHIQTCRAVPLVRALSSWVTVPKKAETKLVTDPGDKQVGLLCNCNAASVCQASKLSCMKLVGGKAFLYG